MSFEPPTCVPPDWQEPKLRTIRRSRMERSMFRLLQAPEREGAIFNGCAFPNQRMVRSCAEEVPVLALKMPVHEQGPAAG